MILCLKCQKKLELICTGTQYRELVMDDFERMEYYYCPDCDLCSAEVRTYRPIYGEYIPEAIEEIRERGRAHAKATKGKAV